MEIWKDIPGWEGLYQVSDLGRVRSLMRMVYAGRGVYRKTRQTILNPGRNRVSGYLYVTLNDESSARRATFNVHSLVATTFLGPRSEGQEARHLDGNPTNASLRNLIYGSHVENMADCARHGTLARGERLPHSLPREEAALIKVRLQTEGISQRRLAKEIGINRSTIAKIMNGTHWSSVSGGGRGI